MKRGNSYVLALAVAVIMTAVTVNMCALDAYAKTRLRHIFFRPVCPRFFVNAKSQKIRKTARPG